MSLAWNIRILNFSQNSPLPSETLALGRKSISLSTHLPVLFSMRTSLGIDLSSVSKPQSKNEHENSNINIKLYIKAFTFQNTNC